MPNYELNKKDTNRYTELEREKLIKPWSSIIMDAFNNICKSVLHNIHIYKIYRYNVCVSVCVLSHNSIKITMKEKGKLEREWTKL